MSTCNITCLNQTWLSTTPPLANWRFENDFSDEQNVYNGTAVGSPTFVQGYVGQAVSFTPSAGQMVSTAYIPLANRSFSVAVWIYPTGLNSVWHHSICGLCPTGSNDYCFHTTLCKNGSFYTLYFGFFGDDVNSYSPAMVVNEWMHAAFTFDATAKKLSVYRNGVFLRSGNTINEFKATTGNFRIGSIPNLVISDDTFQVCYKFCTKTSHVV